MYGCSLEGPIQKLWVSLEKHLRCVTVVEPCQDLDLESGAANRFPQHHYGASASQLLEGWDSRD